MLERYYCAYRQAGKVSGIGHTGKVLFKPVKNLIATASHITYCSRIHRPSGQTGATLLALVDVNGFIGCKGLLQLWIHAWSSDVPEGLKYNAHVLK